MANITWSMVFPAIIVFLMINAVVTICINYERSLSKTGPWPRIWPLILAVIICCTFIGLLFLIALLMYGTPAHYVFDFIDSLINNTFGHLPKLLLMFYFILPCAIAYLCYAVMATIYDHKQKKEYDLALGKGKKKFERKSKSSNKHIRRRKKGRNKRGIDNKKLLNAMITQQDNVSSPLNFRRFVNNAKELTGLAAFNRFWIVLHNEDDLQVLNEEVEEIVETETLPDKYPMVAVGTEQSLKIKSTQEAVNEFRALMREVKE